MKNSVEIILEKKLIKINGIDYTIDSTNRHIWSKLYIDKGEVEAFYSGDVMLGYSCVKDYPEILMTIDKFVREKTGNYIGLGQEWMKLKKGFDCIKFKVKLKDLSYFRNFPTKESISFFDDCMKYDYFSVHDNYPRCAYENIGLLRACINTLNYGYSGNCCTLGIKSNVNIPSSELEIYHNEINV